MVKQRNDMFLLIVNVKCGYAPEWLDEGAYFFLGQFCHIHFFPQSMAYCVFNLRGVQLTLLQDCIL